MAAIQRAVEGSDSARQLSQLSTRPRLYPATSHARSIRAIDVGTVQKEHMEVRRGPRVVCTAESGNHIRVFAASVIPAHKLYSSKSKFRMILKIELIALVLMFVLANMMTRGFEL